jgi:hypothetical protein
MFLFLSLYDCFCIVYGFSQAHEDSAAALAEAHRKLAKSSHVMQAAADALSAHAISVIGRGRQMNSGSNVDWKQSGAFSE